MSEEKQLKVSKLIYEDVAGAGKQIFAKIDSEVNCIEFTMNSGLQPIAIAKLEIVGYEPWIQFKPKEWREMVDKVFTQMVETWNKEYSI